MTEKLKLYYFPRVEKTIRDIEKRYLDDILKSKVSKRDKMERASIIYANAFIHSLGYHWDAIHGDKECILNSWISHPTRYRKGIFDRIEQAEFFLNAILNKSFMYSKGTIFERVESRIGFDGCQTSDYYRIINQINCFCFKKTENRDEFTFENWTEHEPRYKYYFKKIKI